MNGVVKEKLSVFKDDITKAKYGISLTEEKIKLQLQNIEEHKKHNDDEIAKILAEIGKSKEQHNKLQNDIELINKHVKLLNSKIGDKKEKLEKKSKGLFQVKGKIENNIKKNEKDIEFYQHNDNCPTCKQSIEPDFKEQQVEERTNKLGTQKTGLTEVETELENITNEMSDITRIIQHIIEHQNQVTEHNATVRAISTYIDKLNKQYDELSVKVNSPQADNQKLLELKSEMFKFNSAYEELMNEKHYYEFAGSLLKDTGIKTKIIKQYLPIMNKLINKYLTAMDFFVNFNINENFEETIKSRHRDEFSYANFSEGEKMRIDLALLFTWRQIAKMKNSTNTNLLILDEVFDSSLDTVGTEEFLKLIHEMGQDTNVFVISHKGDQLFDKFRSVIKFEKKGNFSRIAK
jgi:chromosome segregation ATPase